MKTLYQPIQTAARVGYAIAAWVLVAMLFVQVFHAGWAVLVSPGDWAPHRSFGAMFSLPVMLMFLLSLIGWMGIRLILLSIGLYALYMTQYLLIYLPGNAGLPAPPPAASRSPAPRSQKGMPSWKSGLTEEQRWQVIAFIKSLKP